MVIIKNIRIKDLLRVLTKLNLDFTLVNLCLEEDTNKITIEGVEIKLIEDKKQELDPDETRLTDDDINSLI